MGMLGNDRRAQACLALYNADLREDDQSATALYVAYRDLSWKQIWFAFWNLPRSPDTYYDFKRNLSGNQYRPLAIYLLENDRLDVWECRIEVDWSVPVLPTVPLFTCELSDATTVGHRRRGNLDIRVGSLSAWMQPDWAASWLELFPYRETN